MYTPHIKPCSKSSVENTVFKHQHFNNHGLILEWGKQRDIIPWLNKTNQFSSL